MAKVTFMDGIATISGRIGDVVFRTSPSGKTYACKAPECVYRKPTRKEMKQRNRFALVCMVRTTGRSCATKSIREGV